MRKIMHRSSITILLIAAVIIGLVGIMYINGTISSGNRPANLQPDANADGGLQTVSGTTQSSLTTFEEALDQLQQHLKGTPSSSNFTLHYIRGTDLDYLGRAAHWVFGVRYDNQSVLIYFDAPGWRSVSWEGAAPEKEITMESFASPRSVIRRNAELLSGGDPVEKILIRRLELGNGKYIVTTARQEHLQTFVFDAGSGGLIP